jgi:hypothetical protein
MSDGCKVCGIPHDAQVHRAVENVRRWLRERVCGPPPRKPSASKPRVLQNIVLHGTKRP